MFPKIRLAVFLFCFLTPYCIGFELIAHRGVHQTYIREGLTFTTCTATRIHNTGHSYLENTLESIESAFAHGADIVEVDVHPTREEDGNPEKLAVFHDWGIECRTDGSCENGCNCDERGLCVTSKQSMAYLKSLDIGYGYTYDDGKSFPFRGRFIGAMPELTEILELLKSYPDKKILVNLKGNHERSTMAFLREIAHYPKEIRQRVIYSRRFGHTEQLDALGIAEDIIQADRACFKKYILVGWLGIFPENCRNKKIMVPIRQTLGIIDPKLENVKLVSLLWGWPEKFIARANKHGTEVYAAQVDSVEEYNEMIKLPLAGIMTNKIEIIGPVDTAKNATANR